MKKRTGLYFIQLILLLSLGTARVFLPLLTRAFRAIHSVVVKVGMVGDSQIGKTSLMVKYVEGSFDEDYIQTLGSFATTPHTKTEGANISVFQVLTLWKRPFLFEGLQSPFPFGIWEVCVT